MSNIGLFDPFYTVSLLLSISFCILETEFKMSVKRTCIVDFTTPVPYTRMELYLGLTLLYSNLPSLMIWNSNDEWYRWQIVHRNQIKPFIGFRIHMQNFNNDPFLSFYFWHQQFKTAADASCEHLVLHPDYPFLFWHIFKTNVLLIESHSK